MVGDKRSIESDAEPLPGEEEEDVEENMEDVLRQHQRVQTGALVYRILVVSFQLIKSNDLQRKLLYKYQQAINHKSLKTYVENGEENEESIDDESNNVGKSCKSKGHSAPFPLLLTIISETFLVFIIQYNIHKYPMT